MIFHNCLLWKSCKLFKCLYAHLILRDEKSIILLVLCYVSPDIHALENLVEYVNTP